MSAQRERDRRDAEQSAGWCYRHDAWETVCADSHVAEELRILADIGRRSDMERVTDGIGRGYGS